MPKMKIDVASLTVVSFPTTAVAANADALSIPLDTRLDCSTKCREPTNIYQTC